MFFLCNCHLPSSSFYPLQEYEDDDDADLQVEIHATKRGGSQRRGSQRGPAVVDPAPQLPDAEEEEEAPRPARRRRRG